MQAEAAFADVAMTALPTLPPLSAARHCCAVCPGSSRPDDAAFRHFCAAPVCAFTTFAAASFIDVTHLVWALDCTCARHGAAAATIDSKPASTADVARTRPI